MLFIFSWSVIGIVIAIIFFGIGVWIKSAFDGDPDASATLIDAILVILMVSFVFSVIYLTSYYIDKKPKPQTVQVESTH